MSQSLTDLYHASKQLKSSDNSLDLLRVFDQHIEPILVKATRDESLEHNVKLFSFANNLLFVPFIKRINTSDHFLASYWRMTNLTLPIANQVSNLLDSNASTHIEDKKQSFSSINILWMIKGDFELAHMDIPKNFLYGWQKHQVNDKSIDFPRTRQYLLFLDIEIPNKLKHSNNVFALPPGLTSLRKLVELRYARS